MTDAKRQEHCGNEAREQRVIVSTVSEFFELRLAIRRSVIGTSTNIYIDFIEAPRAARYASGLGPDVLLAGTGHRLSVRFWQGTSLYQDVEEC
ncbi:hypothetical protein [Bradyrhizobium genosp. SA-3]|uniref:hypothetical protein n=1 Tax=Bradyrhizobium genosp. SA-3 TaxID=508868 RepID=UPI00102A7272|nr:hypothetical protein [Bradyrhizobium genosp. SA-3]